MSKTLKKSILLIIIALGILFLGKTTVNATTMSDEFKQILNDEGKLVVTDTTLSENKITFLKEYLNNKYKVSNYNEENSTCDLTFFNTNETHNIEVVYEERISDDFNSILKNGKLQIPSSSKNGVRESIDRYLQRISEDNQKYYFGCSYYEHNEEGEEAEDETVLINKECTKVTIRMKNRETGILEQHTVEILYLTKMSENFKKKLNLNESGKLILNSTEPKNGDDMFWLLYLKFNENNPEEGYYFENPSADCTEIDITIDPNKESEETHRVKIGYDYDKKIKQKLQGFISSFPKNIEFFHVRDLDIINYFIYNIESDDTEHLDAFSGELKSAIKNNNIKYSVYNKMGDGMFERLFVERKGIALFEFNDVIYYMDSGLGTKAQSIIYVPNGTGNTKEKLMEAAQKRIDEYLGKRATATITYKESAYDYWLHTQYEENVQDKANLTFEEFVSKKYDYINKESEEEDLKNYFGNNGIAKNDDIFNVTIKVGNKEKSFPFVIKKDSSKMIKPNHTTTDMITNVEINSPATSVPLDTSVEAEKITEGNEYDRIIEVLGIKDNEMFDLKLYSDSLEKYIEKLSDGTFEVRIPISEKFKGKNNLIVYYVDENNDKKEYEVEVKDNFAIFYTDHFSIYTLAVGNGAETDTNTNKGEKDETPKTGVESYISYAVMTTIIAGAGIIALKKKI